jgi:hypothetical protein
MAQFQTIEVCAEVTRQMSLAVSPPFGRKFGQVGGAIGGLPRFGRP